MNLVETSLPHLEFKQNTPIDLTVINTSPENTTVVLRNQNLHTVNRIRRCVISEIPTWAFTTMEIYGEHEYHTEGIYSRIELIPVKNPSNKPAVFTLNTKGSYPYTPVWSEDLTCIEGDATVVPGILICKLAQNETLEGEFRIECGTGADHAKWSPVATFRYKERDDDSWEISFDLTGQCSSEELVNTVLQTF